MLTPGLVIDFIEKCFGAAALSNGGLNASVVCPFCAQKTDNLEKKKLVIRTDDFLTHCWVCGYRATNLINLLAKFHPAYLEEYKTTFKIKAKHKLARAHWLESIFHSFGDEVNKTIEIPLEESKVCLPKEFIMIAPNMGKRIRAVDSAWKYLNSRGITKEDLWLWKLGLTQTKDVEDKDYRFRIIVPSFDAEGILNYFSARTYWDQWKGPKYANPSIKRESIIFNELMIDWSQEVTLVEGVFDLMKTPGNSSCLLGSNIDPSYKLFQKIILCNTPILLALDADVKSKTLGIAKLFASYGIRVRILDMINGKLDVGQMTKEEFLQAANAAKEFSMDDYLMEKLLRE